jgi:hypothetical protein
MKSTAPATKLQPSASFLLAGLLLLRGRAHKT